MKDIRNFCKLFNINVPVVEHARYYFNLLEESRYIPNISDLVASYQKFESLFETTEEVFAHKNKSMDQLISFIKDSEAYNSFNTSLKVSSYLKSIPTYDTLNAVGADPDNLFISFDLSKANFQIMKSYDENNELTESWEDLSKKLEIHPIYLHSKPFRQHVFGNLNPNRNQSHQKIIIDKLTNLVTDIIPNLKIALKSADEIVFFFNVMRDKEQLYILNNLDLTKLFTERFGEEYKFSKTRYLLDKIEKNKFVKKSLTIEPGEFNVVKTELKGVEGNMFYMYLKKYIMEKPYDSRDLLFMENKRIASWVQTL